MDAQPEPKAEKEPRLEWEQPRLIRLEAGSAESSPVANADSTPQFGS
jgi:hypothetical protein